jgi:UTP-glucose-1-phosphate uridylyltransferase
MLERTIDELRAADVDGIVIVTSPQKPAIRERLDELGQLDRGDIEFVEQKSPLGLVQALEMARSISGDEMLTAAPDNLFVGHPCPAIELLKVFDRARCTVVGVVQVVRPWGALLSDVGRIDALHESPNDGLQMVSGIKEKRKNSPFPLRNPPHWRCTGRMVLTSEFWEVRGESDVEKLDLLAARGRLAAAAIDASYVDVGIPSGLEFALQELN